MKPFRLALLAVLAFPAGAHAGDVSMVARDVPLGARSLQTVQPPQRFDMVGLHWQGPGTVLFRTHRIGGGWSPWTAGDADTGPDARSAERRATAGWHDGNPAWTGASDGIQFRTQGTVTRLRAFYLWSRVRTEPLRTVALAAQPQIVSRFGWAANEQIVRAKPQVAPALRLAIVHHTVNANAYTRAQAPAIVRGIETYHVKGNGWNDIGYNFLIDRFGTVYEGRAGGIDKPIIGAHAEGFNTGSVGVALIGTYTSAAPTTAQKRALVDLLAWRLDVAHVDPLSFVAFRSLGNSRFRKGAPVTLRAISGHRDTYFTACPGIRLYNQLPAIAKAVSQTGLPKIYAPTAAGDLTEGVTFGATLSAAAPWTVTVTDAAGTVVGSGKGSGTKVAWTWVAPGPGPFRWTIQAASALPASGTLGGVLGPPVTLAGLAVTPVVTPDPSGAGGVAHATFTLGSAGPVTVQVQDAFGQVVQTLMAAQQLPAGQQAADWDAAGVPDGRYRLVVTAGTAKAAADVVVDRTLTGLTTTAAAISPNADGIQDTLTLSFSLAASVPVRIDVQRDGAVVATLSDGTRGPGAQVLDWDGKDAAGMPLPDGSYRLVATVTDALGSVPIALPVTVDSTPPTLMLVDPTTLRFTLSEPATVTLLVNGATVLKTEPAGAFHVPAPKAGVSTVSAQARDAAGNVSQTVSG